MNLILCEVDEVGVGVGVEAGGAVTITGARAVHLRDVLKATPGDVVRVGIVDGRRGEATVLAIEGDRAELRCRFDEEVPPRPTVDLLLALPRPKVLRRLWAQLAALGVGQVILTNAERVERNYFDTHVLTEACYRPLLIEGLQQARDTWLPAVSVHKQFRVLVEDEMEEVFPAGVRLAAHPCPHRSLTGGLRRHSSDPGL